MSTPLAKIEITFESPKGESKTVLLSPEADGTAPNLLDFALDHGIDIDHACGGVCACSTCHVYIKEGLDGCNASSENEEDQLEKAPAVKPYSRLACQTIPNFEKNIRVQVPSWNRNEVREGPESS